MKYKIWMHVESIPDNKDEDPVSMDDYILPEPLAIVDTLEEAEKLMIYVQDLFYQKKR